MIPRPKVSTKSEAISTIKLHCGECNWEQYIISTSKENLKSCPWCGWSDLDISKISNQGVFQNISCEQHGDVTVLVTSKDLGPDDFTDDLWCPYCE